MVSLDPGRPTANAAPEIPERRGRGRTRASAGVPVARVTTGRIAEPTPRNPVWLLGGVLLVLASAIGGMLLFQAGDERTEVLVAGRDLAIGEVIGRDDFRIRRISLDGLEVIRPGEVDSVVGQRAVGPVPNGALVHPGMFDDAEPIGPDQMDIGAALEPGAFPRTDLPLGAAVELLVVADDTPAPDVGVPSATPAPAPVSSLGAVTAVGRGVVVAVEVRASGQLLVTIRVARAIGLTAAQAAAEGHLRLALVDGAAD